MAAPRSSSNSASQLDQRESPILSPSDQHAQNTSSGSKDKEPIPTSSILKGNKDSGNRKKYKKGKDGFSTPVTDSRQPNLKKSRNLNVVRKIISTFKRSGDKKEVTETKSTVEGTDSASDNTQTASCETKDGEEDRSEELEKEFEIEAEVQNDYDSIDGENIRVPLKTIAINELLFPKHQHGETSPRQKRKKDVGLKSESSNTSTTTRTTIGDPNVVSVNSYCDWDDGLDTVSIRTVDLFTNDGELVPGVISTQIRDDASVCTDFGDEITPRCSNSVSHSVSKSKVSKEGRSTPSVPASTRIIHSHVITPFRLSKTNWNVAYENLTLRKCVESIPPEKLALSIPTLTSLKFAQLSSFQVISCCLRSFRNLRRLSFSNIALVQKKSYNENDPRMISLPNVAELEMTQWSSSLTKYEYWLLNVFTRSVNFGRLESFTFRGSDFVVGEKALDKCQKLLENIRDAAVVVRFLVKNRFTLKKVSFGGIGFKMMDHYQATIMEQELGKVNHISDFRINLSTFGIDLLLLNQRHIQNLTFTGYVTDFEESYANLIRKCIESNKNSLLSLGIFPCILGDGTRPFHGSLAPYYFNCGIFEFCYNLKSLFLNITAAQKMFTKRLSCGKVTNLHLLPKSLSTIEIYNHDFDPGDLEKFGQNLFRYRFLHRLVLSSITPNKYVLKVEWVKHLFGLPSFERVDFFGGKLEGGRTFRDYITSKPPGFITMIQISDCISFYKPQLYSTEEEKDDKERSNKALKSQTASTSTRRTRTKSDAEV